MSDLSGSGVRVLLIGTAEYSQSLLPPLPSVGRSLDALSAVLCERCGLDAGRLRVVRNPPDARVMAQAVADEGRTAESVLVVYYLGHGLIGPGDELFLAASGTGELTPGLAAHQALPFSAIAETLTECRAASVVVVLDCCFSGRAAFGLRSAEPAFTLPPAYGVYLLASAERLAMAPEDQTFTIFTGALIDLLTHGDRLGPRSLTLDDAYDYLLRTLRERGGPLPRRQAGDRSGRLVLAANAAQPELAGVTGDEGSAAGRCPYPGLSAFSVDDARMFSGREQLTAELVSAAARALSRSMPLVVVGPSGAGKTSLLHAGLLTRLREGPAELPGSPAWPWITLTPGDHPLQALAARLSPAGAGSGHVGTAEAIRQDPSCAAELVAGLLRRLQATCGYPRPLMVVLVIDQLEQIFVPGISATERAAFLSAIQAITRPPDDSGCRALAVLALRADFYGHAAEYPELHAALRDSQFLMRPMSPSEMRAAIEEPATAAGLLLDEGLADIILHELGAAGATWAGHTSLPLLSHALWAVWQRRSGFRLTVTGYLAAGRVAGAIASTADQAYGRLTGHEKAAVRRMLPRLVRVGDETPDTIREVNRHALLHGLPDQEAARSALDQFVDARLVTVDRDTVRLSHETLLRSWPLLSEWIDADRDWLQASQRLADDARAWRESSEDRSRLYRGGALAAVSERAEKAREADQLAPDAADFLAASWRHERRVGRRRIAAIIVLSVLLLLTMAGGGTALLFQRQAAGQAREALAQLLSTEAGQLRASDPNLATQLSLIAYQVDSRPGADDLLASQGSPGIFDDGEPALDMALQADGRVLAISTGTALRLLDTTTGRLLAQVGSLSTGPVVIGSSRQLLVAATGPVSDLYPVSSYVGSRPSPHLDQIRVWSIADPARPLLLDEVPAHDGKVAALALSPDEQMLVAASTDGAVRIWDLADPRQPALRSSLPGDGKQVDSLTFAPRGRTLATSGADHTIRIWHLTDSEHGRLLAQLSGSTTNLDTSAPVMAHRVAFSPDGHQLAAVTTAGSEEQPEVWDITNPRAPHALPSPSSQFPPGACSHLMGLAFSPNSKGLFASCSDELDIWELTPAQKPGGSVELQPVTTVSGPPGSGTGGQVIAEPHRTLALDISQAGVEIWNLNDPAMPGALASVPVSTGLTPGTLMFSSAGRPLMANIDTASIRLWDLSDPGNPRNLATYPAIVPPGPGEEVNALSAGVALSRDGKILAASEVRDARPVVVLQHTAMPDAAPLATIRGLRDGVMSLGLSRDGHLLAVADNSDYTPAELAPPAIRLFTIQDPAHPRLIASLPGNAFDVTFSLDSRLLAAFTRNMMLIWNITDPGRPIELPPQYLTQASVVAEGAFSPDGTLLAAVDSTGTVWLWRVGHDRLDEPLVTMKQPSSGTGIAFSPDGKTLALSGTENGNDQIQTVNLWDVSHPSAPKLQAQWPTSGGLLIGSLGFSPDGQTLAVEGQSYITLWNTNPARITADLCSSVGDPITPAQWQQYVPGLPYHSPCR